MNGRRTGPPSDPCAPREGRRNGAAAPPCEREGCEGDGLYPAPRSRDELRAWRWFCLDHVREYNRAWNFFRGCGEAEIMAARLGDLRWNRPTWPLGRGPSRRAAAGAGAEALPFGLTGARPEPPPGPAAPRPPGPVLEALAVFGLGAGATLKAIKARYKNLVKSHHPDANGGDARASRRLVRINEAYATLTAFRGRG